MSTYTKVVREAIEDVGRAGVDNTRIEYWAHRIRAAARSALGPETKVEAKLKVKLGSVYSKAVVKGRLKAVHEGLAPEALAKQSSALQTEYNKRLLSSSRVIANARNTALNRALTRFWGWSTSLPPSGATPAARKAIASSMQSLLREDSRVLVDQSNKLYSNLSAIVAEGSSALGGYWHSNYRIPGYNYREDHKDRDGGFYLVRDNWAIRAGLMKKAGLPYTDQISAPAEEPFCQCKYHYKYNLADVPVECLTAKGRAYIEGL